MVIKFLYKCLLKKIVFVFRLCFLKIILLNHSIGYLSFIYKEYNTMDTALSKAVENPEYTFDM